MKRVTLALPGWARTLARVVLSGVALLAVLRLVPLTGPALAVLLAWWGGHELRSGVLPRRLVQLTLALGLLTLAIVPAAWLLRGEVAAPREPDGPAGDDAATHELGHEQRRCCPRRPARGPRRGTETERSLAVHPRRSVPRR